MALLRGKYSEIPEDAVALDEKEALEYQIKILSEWKNSSEVFGVRYGAAILSSASALAGVYINNFYRTRYKLLHYGSLATYLPAAVLPAVTTLAFHMQFVTKNIALQNYECPLCIELRAAALQSIFGCAFPVVLTHIGALAIAQKYLTYDIPNILKDPGKAIALVQKNTKPLLNILFAIFVGQALLASTVTYFENKSVLTVQQRMLEMEELVNEFEERSASRI